MVEDILDYPKDYNSNTTSCSSLMELMEELAGDKSEHGKRQPGEKCMYEIQRKELNNGN